MSTSLRIKFSRTGPVKYLGHLDMMRYFQKAVMRSGIDVRYSEGFNPHQIMSFAYPLGVSMETYGDYMDIDVNTFESPEKITEMLNNVMHEGVEIVATYVLPDGALNAMASVYAADYDVELDCNVSKEEIDKLLSNNELIVTKEGKKGPVSKDIKPGIFELTAENNILYMKVKSGSTLNIKPSDVVDLLSQSSGRNYKIIQITRKETYRLNENDKIVSLGEF